MYQKKNWSIGDVKIFDKENITINSDSYTKRTKITSKGLWVNTKPNILYKKDYHTFSKNIYINYFDKELIIYRPNTSLIVYKPCKLSICVNNNLYPSYKKVSYFNYYIYPSLLFIVCILLYIISFIFTEEDVVIIQGPAIK